MLRQILLRGHFDEALVQAFPDPEPMSVLLVGGACLLLQGITAQPTDSVDVIIFEMLGSEERTLVFHSPIADTIRRIIREIGKRHVCSHLMFEISRDAESAERSATTPAMSRSAPRRG